MVTELTYFTENKERFLTSFDYYICWYPYYYDINDYLNREEWLKFDLDQSFGDYCFSKTLLKINLSSTSKSKSKSEVIIPCIRACVMINYFNIKGSPPYQTPPLKWNKDIDFEMSNENIPINNMNNIEKAFIHILKQLNNNSEFHNKRIVADYPDFFNIYSKIHYGYPTVKFYREFVKDKFEPLLFNLNLFLAKEIY